MKTKFEEHSFKISAVEGTVMSFKGREKLEKKYLFTTKLLNKQKIVTTLNVLHVSLSLARARKHKHTNTKFCIKNFLMFPRARVCVRACVLDRERERDNSTNI
jgi:hypothetical protein